MQVLVSVGLPASQSGIASLVKDGFPLLLPVATALVAWLGARWQKRRVLRSAYFAQLQSMKIFIDEEIEFVDAGNQWTWFPALPFFADPGGPLGTAGVLRAIEVNALMFAYFAYRERLTYISQYGTLGQVSDSADQAFKVALTTDFQSYRNDLFAIKGAVDRAHDLLARSVVRTEKLPQLPADATRMQHGAD